MDIVQAVGRAMRKPRGASAKTTGYIILPVFLSKKELKDPETAVEGSAFAPVLQVLRALKAHDPYRATFFAKILVEEGKRPHKKGEGIDEILQVSIGKELDRALAKRLEHAVQLRAVEVAADRFEFWLELLKHYVEREQNALVPHNWLEQGHKLGRWVNDTRTKQLSLPAHRKHALDQLHFVWNVPDQVFELNLKAIAQYAEREGHTLVPALWKEGDVRLGTIVNTLRTSRINGSLSNSQIAALDSIGFVWDHWEEQFNRNIFLLQGYLAQHGKHPTRNVSVEGVKLGLWVNHLRDGSIKLALHQRKRLEEIGFVFDPHDSLFLMNYDILKRYAAREGHPNVPVSWVEDKVKLGIWVANMRKRKATLSMDKIQLLESLGFEWRRRLNDKKKTTR